MFPGDSTVFPGRRPLTLMPAAVAVLCAGLLIDAAATVWDLRHTDDIFNAGTSQNGAIAFLIETGLAWLRLAGTAVLTPLLWFAAFRARRPVSRTRAVLAVSGVLFAAGGALMIPVNDGSDPRLLGFVHDDTVPVWITVSDAAAPAAILAGALAMLLLLLRAALAGADGRTGVR